MRFRPCIDLHDGQVKQIVGATLGREGDEQPRTNFASPHPPAHYARLYRRDNLTGGHVIMLGPGNEQAACEALAAWPGGFQVGGGITADNAASWLDRGASHVIVTSHVFHDGLLDQERLEALCRRVGRRRLVLDLSCRRLQGRYLVVTDRWQTFTRLEVNGRLLERLAKYCDEFLVHGVDVEGRCAGVDRELIEILAERTPIPVTYAGGVSSLADLALVREAGSGRLDVTVGSALDVFGGDLPYRDVVRYCARQ